MSSISKIQKGCREFKDVIGVPLSELYEDRITNLLDELKTKILSCLDTKDAVRTSILSKNWKHSWKSITNLVFLDYANPTSEGFKSFVSRVLQLHDRSCLDTFYLRCCLVNDGHLINLWKASILLSNVQEIKITVSLAYPLLLCSDIFLCKTLVVLQVHLDGYVNMPSCVCLPRLKSLDLDGVELSDDRSISILFSGCPVLEELKLRRCISKNVRVVNIVAPVLKSLTVGSLVSYFDLGPSWFTTYKILLDTPALLYLDTHEFWVDDYIVKDIGHLITACIFQFDKIHGESLLNLYKGISSVRSLKLSDSLMKVIHQSDIELPTFDHMTELKLQTSVFSNTEYHISLLFPILHNTPRLEKLEIGEGLQFYCFPTDAYLLENTPSCLLSHIKVITIRSFFKSPFEMGMVKYLLMEAKVLETLTLDVRPKSISNNIPELLRKDVLVFPRCSKHCRISVI